MFIYSVEISLAMVESLSELRKLVNKGEKESFFAQYFLREVALLFTKFFLYFNWITPTHVTLMSMLSGMIAVVLFAFGRYHYDIMGALFLYMWIFLDYSDGQIARYKKKYTVEGHNLDRLNDNFIDILCFTAITFGTYVKTQDLLLLGLGLIMVSSMSLYNISANVRYPLYLFVKSYNFKKWVSNNQIKQDVEVNELTTNLNGDSNKTIPAPNTGFILRIIRKLSSFIGVYSLPLRVNMVLFTAVFNKFEYLVYFYAIIFPPFLIANLYHQYYGGLKNFIKRTDSYIIDGKLKSFNEA